MEKPKSISGILILESDVIELNTGLYTRMLTIQELEVLKEKAESTLANYKFNNVNAEQIKNHNVRQADLAYHKELKRSGI